MANKTIGNLSTITSANDNDYLIIEQSGSTYKITKGQLVASIKQQLDRDIAGEMCDDLLKIIKEN